jgi:hypothetical protein
MTPARAAHGEHMIKTAISYILIIICASPGCLLLAYSVWLLSNEIWSPGSGY